MIKFIIVVVVFAYLFIRFLLYLNRNEDGVSKMNFNGKNYHFSLY